MKDALTLREMIYNIFQAIARGREVAAQFLDGLREMNSQAIHHAEIVPNGQGFSLIWTYDPDDLMSPLWPIAHSALDLLLRGDHERIKECPIDEGCGWLFYDTSKNNSRRWCSMRTCGMDAKERQRAKRSRSRKTTGSDS